MTKGDIETAIQEFKKKMIEKFGAETEIYLFGSAARGDYTIYSDIDLLVLLPLETNNSIEEQVFDYGYDIELRYGVVFGIIVYSKMFWNSETAGSMPLYKNIKREGLFV